MYAEDFDRQYPARRVPPDAWPHKLKSYFLDWQILVCPSDRFGLAGLLADEANPKRSFLINGFNDFFLNNLSEADYSVHKNWKWPFGMKESDIPLPSATIVFGGKKKNSFHVHMDIDQGRQGNEIEEVERARHGRGANFAFADGSVRLLVGRGDIEPENQWAVVEEFRRAPKVGE
jgi:prepilin-type processing-associated H-X9-DG protein